MQSYSTINIKHHRNIILLMSLMPLLVMLLVAGVFYQGNKNNFAKAALIFSTGFENGSLSEWNGGQCMRSYSCTASTNAPRSGNYSSRYEVRDGDCPITGTQCYGERAEKQSGTIGSYMSSSEGQNRWYSWSMKLEDGFPNSTRWQVISQWHSANNGSPAVAYYISGRSMYMQHYDPNVGYVQHWYNPTLNTGQWIDLKMNIYWTSSTSGYVRLWINGQEQSRYNGATLRAGEGTYFKQGYYRDQAVSGTGIVYYDNLKVATSEADLGGSSPAPSPPPPAPAPTPPPPAPAPNPQPTPSGQSPYTGSAQSLPGKVESENYDNGGEGVAYHDTSSTNVTGKYRNDGVDIENATGGGYNVGYNDPGEWREHTVNIPSGTYTISARVSSAVDGGQLVIKLGSTTITTINVPNTGGWQSYQNPSVANIAITGGNGTILRFETAGNSYTIDSVTFTKQGTQTNPGPNPQPTPTPSPTPNPSTPPPLEVPGAGTSEPVDIPAEIPVQEDGSIIADFNGDGLNDVVKDLNNDGKIDPMQEIVVDGTNERSLTDITQSPISADEYLSSLGGTETDNGVVKLKAGPLPEVRIAKPVAYTFLIAQGIAITGISSYLALTKLAIFAGIRSKWSQ